ncbi:alpha-ketoglutarate-dependent dioxygenase alkb-like protein [Lasius niger]|uniref:DNA oxidative demethylase ALKBH2 n=1 Tax=Lasius niger TaxID=67767 RepID=A0A0J7MQS9_LASNI|nr:alpha-ketoglutarate-dependent dioxygenase alkb-like protein [Lasius niger]
MENFNIELFDNVFEHPKDIFQRLETEIQYIPATQCEVNIYGKSYKIPRQLAAYGDPDLTYTFSGLTVACNIWTPLLLDLKKAVEKVSGTSYNFVIINRYKDGNSCIGQHKDNEPDLDPTSPISSLSFGENRTMVFKKAGCEDQRIELQDNSLMVMRTPTNTEWTHGIPRQKDRKGVRINLTFRKIVNKKKRKLDPEPVVPAKKSKTMIEGAFTEGEGENVFPIGQDKFVVLSTTSRNNVIVHLRQYKRHGVKLYPTKTGVTLQPEWFDRVFARTAPRTPTELEAAHFFVPAHFKIRTQDFTRFELQRDQKCISITDTEWDFIASKLATITTLAIQYQFQTWDFKKEYEQLHFQDLPDAQHALEFSNPSPQDFQKILVSCVCELVKLQEEVASACLFGDPAVLRPDSIIYFNRCVLMFTLKELVQLFKDRVYGYASPIIPTAQSIEQFLNSVQLTQVIDEARFETCALEYLVQAM